jgi:hypothetical protein
LIKTLSAFELMADKKSHGLKKININPLTPELNPSAQRCLPRFFTGDFNF